jgi:MFS family permease
MRNRRYYPTAMALYFTYFIHGIGVSILGQYKQDFAGMWGANTLADGTFDVSVVISVIAALGLGRLIALLFSGTISDRFGRRVSGLIGAACYAVYFAGIVLSANVYAAYAFALIGGAANSFLDTCVTPSCLEIFSDAGDVANMFTKFAMSIGQFLLPFMIGFVAANKMPYSTIFLLAAGLIIIDGILIAFMPFPPKNRVHEGKIVSKVESKKIKFTPLSIAVICIGFTSTATFQLWLNCNQELGKLYGLADPSKIQSFYSAGTVAAILATSVIVKKFIKPIRILVIYPVISTVMLFVVYLVQAPVVCLIGGFVIGYAAAGGVLQLAVSTANSLFPASKGKITSIVMIASSMANYVILNIAGLITKASGAYGPKYILLFNAGITIVGILLALFVNKQYEKEAVS